MVNIKGDIYNTFMKIKESISHYFKDNSELENTASENSILEEYERVYELLTMLPIEHQPIFNVVARELDNTIHIMEQNLEVYEEYILEFNELFNVVRLYLEEYVIKKNTNFPASLQKILIYVIKLLKESVLEEESKLLATKTNSPTLLQIGQKVRSAEDVYDDIQSKLKVISRKQTFDSRYDEIRNKLLEERNVTREDTSKIFELPEEKQTEHTSTENYSEIISNIAQEIEPSSTKIHL